MHVMEELMEKFIKYAEFDEDGDLIGIKKNAPEDALKAYDEFESIQEQAHRRGEKI